MIPEPLIGKRRKHIKPNDDHNYSDYVEGLSVGYESAMIDVLSAVTFYERYRYDRILLYDEQPIAWNDWRKSKTIDYGRWLWYYTWKDVRK